MRRYGGLKPRLPASLALPCPAWSEAPPHGPRLVYLDPDEGSIGERQQALAALATVRDPVESLETAGLPLRAHPEPLSGMASYCSRLPL